MARTHGATPLYSSGRTSTSVTGQLSYGVAQLFGFAFICFASNIGMAGVIQRPIWETEIVFSLRFGYFVVAGLWFIIIFKLC